MKHLDMSQLTTVLAPDRRITMSKKWEDGRIIPSNLTISNNFHFWNINNQGVDII